jgi:hypothetical protein
MDSRGWTSSVVGQVSRWIDLDAKCPRARLASEKAFKQEIAWATHLSVGAVLLPPVRSHQQCANYARVLNQAATQAQYLQVRAVACCMQAPKLVLSSNGSMAGVYGIATQFWVRVPLAYRQGPQIDTEDDIETDKTITMTGAVLHDTDDDELDPWMVRLVFVLALGLITKEMLNQQFVGIRLGTHCGRNASSTRRSTLRSKSRPICRLQSNSSDGLVNQFGCVTSCAVVHAIVEPLLS